MFNVNKSPLYFMGLLCRYGVIDNHFSILAFFSFFRDIIVIIITNK